MTVHPVPLSARPRASKLRDAFEIAAMIVGIGFFTVVCVGLGLFAAAAAMGGR